jgi:hypothetical protein
MHNSEDINTFLNQLNSAHPALVAGDQGEGHSTLIEIIEEVSKKQRFA